MAVVVAQVPVARFAEGLRRALTMALAGALFCGACLLVEVADASRAIAYAVLIAAVIVAGVGECLHTTALTPLVAELAPAHLRGRYMAVVGLCFWIGLAAAPTGGTALLSLSPTAAFGVAAGVALAAAVSMLRLERRLPETARLTPRPRRQPLASAAPLAPPGGAASSPPGGVIEVGWPVFRTTPAGRPQRRPGATGRPG
jgi:MFS family permease